MFLEINNIPYNVYDISSFNKRNDTIENSDGTTLTVYNIVYQISNGTVLLTAYDTEKARDDAYDSLVDKLVVKL